MEVKKKLGRPKSGRRDKYVSMPLNKAEFEHLKEYCKSINTNVSVTIRTLIFQGLESIKSSTTK